MRNAISLPAPGAGSRSQVWWLVASTNSEGKSPAPVSQQTLPAALSRTNSLLPNTPHLSRTVHGGGQSRRVDGYTGKYGWRGQWEGNTPLQGCGPPIHSERSRPDMRFSTEFLRNSLSVLPTSSLAPRFKLKRTPREDTQREITKCENGCGRGKKTKFWVVRGGWSSEGGSVGLSGAMGNRSNTQ